jgi:hypothetical protein
MLVMSKMKAECACNERILVSSKEMVDGRGATRRGHISSGKGNQVNVTFEVVMCSELR